MNTICNYFIGTLAISAVTITSAYAETEEISCNRMAKIYYGNGILSTPDDRKLSLNTIKERLKKELSKEDFSQLEFSIANNTTAGWIRDIAESIIQDNNTDWTSFYRMLSGIDVMPGSIQEYFNNKAAEIDKESLLSNQDLAHHVEYYNKDILDGKNVIVIAHSQGNFFTNQAYYLINNTYLNNFRIVSVANPDNFVGGNGDHTTLFEDKVINLIRYKPSSDPMYANSTNAFSSDPRGHSFINAYMAKDGLSDQKITQDITAALDSFPDVTCANTVNEFIVSSKTFSNNRPSEWFSLIPPSGDTLNRVSMKVDYHNVITPFHRDTQSKYSNSSLSLQFRNVNTGLSGSYTEVPPLVAYAICDRRGYCRRGSDSQGDIVFTVPRTFLFDSDGNSKYTDVRAFLSMNGNTNYGNSSAKGRINISIR